MEFDLTNGDVVVVCEVNDDTVFVVDCAVVVDGVAVVVGVVIAADDDVSVCVVDAEKVVVVRADAVVVDDVFVVVVDGVGNVVVRIARLVGCVVDDVVVVVVDVAVVGSVAVAVDSCAGEIFGFFDFFFVGVVFVGRISSELFTDPLRFRGAEGFLGA